MKWKVDLYVGGKVFPEYVQAVNRSDAIETANARNQKASLISTNVILNELLLVVKALS